MWANSTALQNGYQQGQEVQRNGSQSTTNHSQPPAPQYGQPNGYSSVTYNSSSNSVPVGDSGQILASSVPSATHPPLYPPPNAYQYAQASNSLGADAGYQINPAPTHGLVYGNSVNYQQDVQQQQQPPPPSQMSTPLPNSGNYVMYPPQVSNQPADALMSFSGWDDANAAVQWPNVIFMQPQSQPQPQQQQQQQQQQEQQQQHQQQQQ